MTRIVFVLFLLTWSAGLCQDQERIPHLDPQSVGDNSVYITNNSGTMEVVDQNGSAEPTSSSGGGSGLFAEGLTAFNNTTNPNHQIDVTVDVLGMVSEDGSASAIAHGVSDTWDITTDLPPAESESSNTWYYLWAYTLDSGVTVNTSFTSSASDLTGVDADVPRIRLMSIYNDGANFRTIRRYGKRTQYQASYPTAASATFNTTIWTSVSLSSYVPPHSKVAWGHIGVLGSAGGNVHVHVTGDNSDGTNYITTADHIMIYHIANSPSTKGFFEVYMKTSQTIYWGNQDSINNGTKRLHLGGYYEDYDS